MFITGCTLCSKVQRHKIFQATDKKLCKHTAAIIILVIHNFPVYLSICGLSLPLYYSYFYQMFINQRFQYAWFEDEHELQFNNILRCVNLFLAKA